MHSRHVDVKLLYRNRNSRALNFNSHVLNFDFYLTQRIFAYAIKQRRTFLPAKSDSDVMFCLQSYQGLMIDRSLVY